MNEQEFAELSAGHALGALPPEDERAYRDALRAHPQWRAIVDLDRETAAALGDGVPSVAPPVQLRSQLLGRIRADADAGQVAAGDAADADVGGDAPSGPVPLPSIAPEEAAARAAAPPTEVVQAIQRRNWTRGVFALVASIAVLVGIGWGVGAITEALRTPPAVSALAQIEAAPDAQSATGVLGDGGEATLHWSESLGDAVLVASGLPEIPSGQTFELWYVREGTPISAGTFDASDSEATALLAGKMQAGDAVAVTVEQSGGSPDGAPTTDPIVTIASAES